LLRHQEKLDRTDQPYIPRGKIEREDNKSGGFKVDALRWYRMATLRAQTEVPPSLNEVNYLLCPFAHHGVLHRGSATIFLRDYMLFMVL
jgi:hypothetical protein